MLPELGQQQAEIEMRRQVGRLVSYRLRERFHGLAIFAIPLQLHRHRVVVLLFTLRRLLEGLPCEANTGVRRGRVDQALVLPVQHMRCGR
jgi:hypothetical protein